jgi:hypothetical protein
MKFRLIMGLIIGLLFSAPAAYASLANPNLLIYSAGNPDEGWKVGWRSVPDSELSGQIDIPFAPGAFSAPPRDHFFAIADVTSDTIYIIDVLTSSLVKLDIPLLHKEGFAYDMEYIAARSMRWSPDGTTLAFIGQTENERADLYLYETSTGQLNNLTSAIDFTSDFLNLSDWSPDGQWLALTGQWQPDTGWLIGGILSKDGKTFLKLNSSEPICRLTWSPGQQYLFSPTDCSGYPADQQPANVMIFPVDLSAAEEQPLASFHLDGDTQNSWHYDQPTWADENTIWALRSIVQPMLNGTAVGTPAPKPQLIQYDVDTRALEIISANEMELNALRYGTAFGQWIFWLDRKADPNAIYAFNLAARKQIYIAYMSSDVCPERYFRLSPDQSYLAFIDGCNQDILHRLIILNIVDNAEVFQEQSAVPLGWIELVSIEN